MNILFSNFDCHCVQAVTSGQLATNYEPISPLSSFITESFMKAAHSSPARLAIQTLAQIVLLSARLHVLQPAVALLARLYVAHVFFSAGLTKVRDWETTLLLFTDEYKVPLLSPAVAAVMGTGGELLLPVFLALGLCGRLGALGLSVINVVAVMSLTEIAAAALQQHILWGALLAGVAIYGPGSWSADRFLFEENEN